MNTGWLVAGIVVVVAALAVRRRMRMPPERRRELSERGGLTMRRVEAYLWPPLGVVLAFAAIHDWGGWVSLAVLATGVLFLAAGLSSFRELRRRRLS